MKHKTSAGGLVATILQGKLHVLFITFKSGLLSFPKGHTKEGEAYEETALREMKEEIGLRNAEVIQKLGVITREGTEHDGSKSRKDIHLYLMKAEEYTFAHEEDYVWIDFDRALDLMDWEQEKDFLIEHKETVEKHVSPYFTEAEQEPKWDERHEKQPTEEQQTDYFVDAIKNHIKEKNRILQIGISNGTDALFFAKEKEAEVYGVDISNIALKKVQQMFQEKKIEHAFFPIHRNAQNLLISDIPENLDSCIARFSLNLSDTKVFFLINEILKRMKVGGYIIIEGFTSNDETVKKSKDVGPHIVQDGNGIFLRVWDETYVKTSLEEKLKLTIVAMERKEYQQDKESIICILQKQTDYVY